MKDVVRVSIGKTAFSLEHEAYVRMNAYLNSLEECFSGRIDGSEILEEVEERAASLLCERISPDDVVKLSTIEDVIDILGAPKDYVDDAASERRSTSPDEETGATKVNRRFMRDVANKKIAGVCSGLAAYFDREPVLVRILFIVVQLISIPISKHDPWLFTPALVYLTFWCAMPAARTSVQKARMRGRNFDIDDIVEQGPAQDGSSDHTLSKAFRVIVGVCLLFFGVIGLFAGIVALSTFLGIVPSVAFPLFDSIVGKCHGVLSLVSLILVFGLPVVGLLYGGIMLSFGLRSPKWHPGLMIFLIWFISLMIGGYAAVRTALCFRNLNNETSVKSEYTLPSDTLRIKLAGTPIEARDYIYGANKYNYELILLNRKEIYVAPKIHVRRVDTDSSSVHNISVESNSYAVRPSFVDEHGFTRYSEGTLVVDTQTFRKGDGEPEDLVRSIDITIPENVKVLLEGPRNHDFEQSSHKTSFWFVN